MMSESKIISILEASASPLLPRYAGLFYWSKLIIKQYTDEQIEKSRKAMDELIELSEELGLYDDPPPKSEDTEHNFPPA